MNTPLVQEYDVEFLELLLQVFLPASEAMTAAENPAEDTNCPEKRIKNFILDVFEKNKARFW